MLVLLSLTSILYFGRINGEMAGLNNIILQPEYELGIYNELTLTAFPKWHNDLDVYTLYGQTLIELGYRPVLGFDWRYEMFFLGTKIHPKLSFFANTQFWFAKKANVKLFNSHDGIGATKRELYLNYGLNYFITHDTALYLETYAYNNLNRGTSATNPTGFRDGYNLGIRYKF
jgi:hypothetical protein